MGVQSAVLVGRITMHGCLSASLNTFDSFVGYMSKPIGYIDYNGSYEVIPKTSEQTLKTKDKHMTDDLKIKSIPIFNVSNETGGSTVYIGSEV